MEDDDNDGEKILTIEDFRKRAMEKLEVYIKLYYLRPKSNRTLIKTKELDQLNQEKSE